MIAARGWLLVLCALLFIWEPLRLAAEFSGSIGTIAMRGPVAIAELVAHAAAAALAVAAAWALWNLNPAAPQIAIIALVLSAAVSVQSLYWSSLPHQTAPGERLPSAVLAVLHACAWIAYLLRSRRVRTIYG